MSEKLSVGTPLPKVPVLAARQRSGSRSPVQVISQGSARHPDRRVLRIHGLQRR
jgi:hypothetical protein